LLRCTFEQHRGRGRESARVVVRARAVRRADLDQARAARREDLRHAEPAADLHQLAARDHHLAPRRERRGHEQHRGSAVVHHERVLGAHQRGAQLGHEPVAVPAPPAREVVLERRVALRDRDDVREHLVAQGRAAEVGVQHHARGVDHAPQPRRARARRLGLEQRQRARGERLAVLGRAAREQLLAQSVEHAAHGVAHGVVRQRLRERARRGRLQERVGGRQRAQAPRGLGVQASRR
jgi:hypothetical protein